MLLSPYRGAHRSTEPEHICPIDTPSLYAASCMLQTETRASTSYTTKSLPPLHRGTLDGARVLRCASVQLSSSKASTQSRSDTDTVYGQRPPSIKTRHPPRPRPCTLACPSLSKPHRATPDAPRAAQAVRPYCAGLSGARRIHACKGRKGLMRRAFATTLSGIPRRRA